MIGIGWLIAAGVAVVGAVVGVAHSLSKSSYDSTSIENRINVEEELKKFKENTKESAEKIEEKWLTQCNTIFDEIERSLTGSAASSDVKSYITHQRSNIKNVMRGTISSYVERTLSENDSQFETILKMKPGNEKEAKIRNQIDSIIDRAVTEFSEKLKKEVQRFSKELFCRLSIKQDELSRELAEREESYRTLLEEKQKGTINMDDLRNEYMVAANAENCIKRTLLSTDKV